MRVVACLLFALALVLQCAAQQTPVMRILHAYPAQSSLAVTLVFSNGTQKVICTLNFGKQCNAPTLAVGTSVQVIASSSSHSAVAKSNVTIGQGSFTLAIAPAVPQSKTQAAIFVSADAPQSVPSSSFSMSWVNLINGTVTIEDASFDIFVDDLPYGQTSSVTGNNVGGKYGFLIAGESLISTGITFLPNGFQYVLFVIGQLSGSVKPTVAIVTV